jgi:hypothetical protein
VKSKNVKELLHLSRFCRYSGIASLGLGAFVIGMDFLLQDFVHMQVGFFIFVCGYAFLKTGTKISTLLFDERTELSLD